MSAFCPLVKKPVGLPEAVIYVEPVATTEMSGPPDCGQADWPIGIGQLHPVANLNLELTQQVVRRGKPRSVSQSGLDFRGWRRCKACGGVRLIHRQVNCGEENLMAPEGRLRKAPCTHGRNPGNIGYFRAYVIRKFCCPDRRDGSGCGHEKVCRDVLKNDLLHRVLKRARHTGCSHRHGECNRERCHRDRVAFARLNEMVGGKTSRRTAYACKHDAEHARPNHRH